MIPSQLSTPRQARTFGECLASAREKLQRGDSKASAWICEGQDDANLVDLESLKNTSGFAMRMGSPGADDALVAAGVALEAGRPSLYLVPDRKTLPWFLQEADLSYPGQVCIVEGKDPGAVLNACGLSANPPDPSKVPTPALFPEDPEAGGPDTFIGCIMSGLTPEQYAEGRSHLQAIDESLKVNFGSPRNFCEGIRVFAPGSFGTPQERLPADLAAVRESRRCVFYVYDATPRPSGMWVELGAAMAQGKSCTVLAPCRESLPPCLQGDALPKGMRVVFYGDHDAMLRQISEDPRLLLG